MYIHIYMCVRVRAICMYMGWFHFLIARKFQGVINCKVEANVNNADGVSRRDILHCFVSTISMVSLWFL